MAIRFIKHIVLATTLTFASPTIVQAADIPERADVPATYKWNLSTMYSSATAWEADKARFLELLPKIEAYEGRLAENGEILLAAIEQDATISQLIDNLYVYAGLKSFEDTRASENTARWSEAQELVTKYNEAHSFFTPELLKIPANTLTQMIESTKGLSTYRFYLDEQVRMRPYTLNASEEKLLALVSNPLNKYTGVFNAINNADLKFDSITNKNGEKVELTNSRYSAFIYSQDRQIRQAAWQSLHSGFKSLNHTLAANYEGHVKSRVFLAKARNFESRLDAATYTNGIPKEVYFNLIKEVRAGVEPLQRFLKLRQRILGVKQLEVWDLYAPIAEPAIDNITFETGKTIVADALTPLGDDYLNIYWKGFDEGWVDVVNNRGKRSGAYSWGTYTSKPYLSMNFEGTFNDVSTLAHEYGHSIHRYLSNHNQPYVYSSNRIFLAEVASMTNEAILIQTLLKEATSAKERVYLLTNYLDKFRGSFYRQTTFADFELQAHTKIEAGEALTSDVLNGIYKDIFKVYYGDAVHADELNQYEWSRIPHFLRSDNFYVYQYSTSFAAAQVLAKQIIEEGEPARARFLALLKSGSSGNSIELLKKAGVDMTTPQPIRDTIETFNVYVDKLEQALTKMETKS